MVLEAGPAHDSSSTVRLLAKDSLVIYCDRLSIRALARILVLRIRGRAGDCGVRLLDEPSGAGQRNLRRVLRLVGIPVVEVAFHAGSMCSVDGERLPWVASSIAQNLVFAQAEALVSTSSTLGAINARWGRRTVELHIAKRSWGPVFELVLRILVASELARSESNRSITLMHRPWFIGARQIRDRFADVELCLCGPAGDLGASIRYALGRISSVFRGSASAVVKPDLPPKEEVATPSAPLATVDPTVPGLLLLQKDDLGVDRSYRTQPHWLFAGEDCPQFRTYVLGTSYVDRTPHDARALGLLGVTVLSTLTPFVFHSSKRGRTVLNRLVSDAVRCAFGFLIRRGELSSAFRTTLALLLHAWILGRLCRALNIKVFLSGEGFLGETDAMQLVGPPLGVTTLGYQYSNMARTNVVMMNTSTTFFTFSDAYGDVFARGDIRPQRTVVNGYPYDSSFECLHQRAATLRSRLEAVGVTFVICFFDENLTPGKYGLICPSEHQAELEALIEMAEEDPTIGLVVKTQYRKNAPSRLYPGHEQLKAVQDAGRYVEISHGAHRNTVFPAEAALASDIAIGHVIGATASLEAALAGRRSIMLNPYGFTGVHDQVYGRAEIVFSSVEDALEAVRGYRVGDPSHEALGDWTPILDYFDPFRDSESGHRMRRLLDELVVNETPRAVVDHGSTSQVSRG
jgi:hypothetical protein